MPDLKSIATTLRQQADLLDPPGGGVVPAPIPVRAGGRRVLTSSQFKLVGVQRLPTTLDENPYGSLALRKLADGTIHFFVIGRMGQSIFEVADGGFGTDFLTCPRATLVKNWGTSIYGSSRQPQSDAHLESQGMFFDPAASTLFVTYANSYDVSPGNKPVLLAIQFNADGTTSASGPWQVDVGQARVRNYLTALPDWFTAYVGGRKLAAGAGLESGSANASWGPGLYAIDTPPLGSPNPVPLASMPLAFYPGTSPDADSFNRRYRRDSNYTPVHGTTGEPLTASTIQYPLPTNGGGYWTGSDYIRTACWIDTPTSSGMLFCGRLSYGSCWYGNPTLANGIKAACGNAKGENASQYSPRWFLYDPVDLALVATGKQQSWQISPTEVFDPTTLLPGLKLGCHCLVNGACFDADTNNLYLCAPQVDTAAGSASPSLVIYKIQISQP